MADRYKQTLLLIVKIGLWIVPLIPLYVSRTLFFPFITGKAFLFRAIIEIVFVAWLLLVLFYKEYRPTKTVLLWAVVIFTAIITLATVLGVNPHKSFWSNFERMEGLIMHWHLLAYFLVLGSVFKKRDWLIFFNLFITAGIAQSFYVILQKLGYFASPQGGFRTDGTLGNATYVAAYSVFVLAIAILLWLESRFKAAKYLYGSAAILALLTIYLTATRGVALAILVATFALGILYIWKSQARNEATKRIKKIVASGLIILLLATVGLKVFQNAEFVKKSEILSRFTSISLSEGKSRFIIWNMGWRGFLERPILGWGPENYNLVFAKHYDPRLYTQEPWFDRSHNIIFDWLISAGFFGLVSYLGIFVAALYLLWRNVSSADPKKTANRTTNLQIAILFSALFFVYFFQNLFVFDQLTTYLSLFAVLAYLQGMRVSAVSAEHGSAGSSKKAFRHNFNLSKLGSAAIAIAIFIPLFYTANYKPFSANRKLIQAMQLGSSGELEESLNAFDSAFSYETFGNSEISEQFAQFTISVIGFDGVETDFKQKIFDKAVVRLRENIAENPFDPRAYLFLGAVYRSGGLFDESAAALRDAVRLSPTKQQIYFELADTYIKKGDYSEAVRVMETAFGLEPQFDEARMNLVASYILNDEQDKADKLLIDGYGKVDVPQAILAQVYLSKGNYERLVGVWSEFVAASPEKIDYHKNLAAVYLKLGRVADAIRVLEEAIEINPEFREEGESYIREIKTANR